MLGSESNDCRGNVRAIARREFLLRSTRWLAVIVGVSLISAGTYGGYGIWRGKHLQKQATEFAARGDVQSAVLVARHLLQLDRNNVAALRIMAELAERSGRPEAVEWRKALAAVQPHNYENQLALASTALRFRQIDLAAHTLTTVDEKLRDNPRFHQIAGALALTQGQAEPAEEHFAAAHEQEPDNHQTALNLAIVRLASTKAGAAEGARENLRHLTELRDVRAAALRALTADALAHGDRDHAQHWASLLVRESAAPFADYLLQLEATREANVAAPALADSQQRAAGNARLSAELITWMNRHELAKDALTWSDSLAPSVRDTQPVPLAIAESLSCARDWRRLLDFVHDKNWGKQEPLRLAVESHAIRHTETDPQSSGEAGNKWRAALNAARGQADQLAAMAQLAEGWGYRAQAADTWWLIANSDTKVKEALLALQRLYKSSHDSRGLLRVAKRALELNPDDLVAANNCASLGLLLNGDSSARRLAAKLHADHPTNEAFAATYAFALHTEGKTAEALQVLESLTEAQLRQPALAAYYVVILTENGNVDRARAFLPAAQRAVLLPEEQQLLTSAARKLVAADVKAIATS
jgi:predicted Zn-dependent protease